MWRAGHAEPDRTVDASDDWVVDLLCSDDGDRVAWRVDTGAAWWVDLRRDLRIELGSVRRPLRALSMSPDGDRCVAALDSVRCEVEVVDPTRGGDSLWSFRDDAPTCDLVSMVEPLGPLVFGVGDESLRLHVGRDPFDEDVAAIDALDAIAVACDPTGRLVAVGGARGEVTWIHVDSLDVLGRTACHDGPVLSMAFDHLGQRLVSGGADGAIVVSAADDRRVTRRIAAGDVPVERVHVSADDRVDAVYRDGARRSFSISTGAELLSKPSVDFAILAVGFAGRALAWSAAGGNVRVWSADDGRRLAGFRIDELGAISALALEPGSLSVAVALRGGDVEVWSAEDGARRARLEGAGGRVAGLRYTASGDRLAAIDGSGTFLLWDVVAAERLLAVPTRVTDPRAIVFSPDERAVWIAGADGVELLRAPDPPPEDE